MSENPTTESQESYKLPTPTFPKMEMPERPEAPGKDEVKMSCEGTLPEVMSGDNSRLPDAIPGVPRIMIGVPVLNFSYEFVQSFLKFWTELCTQVKGKMQVGYYFMYRKPVHMAEIQLVEIAKFNKCTHILLMDDDIYDVTLADLQKLLDADKDVIGGVMYASKFPYAMCVFRRYDTAKKVIDMPSDNIVTRLYEVPCRCTKCGFGLSHWDLKYCPACGAEQNNIIQKADLIPFPFTLIKLSVFDRLKKPWFHCEVEYPTDSWFCDRCHEAGVEIYAHMGVRLNHNGISDLTKPFMFQMELEKKKSTNNQGVIPITAEEMEKHNYILAVKMLEAEEKLKPKPQFETVGDEEAKDVSIQSDR